jgi:endonuclease/exonuclease/phosphatase family metal-dependent hydrolase
MGDFNCGEDDPPYRTLLGGEKTEKPAANTLIDAYRHIHPRNGRPETTRHDFGLRTCGPRIDWILHSRRFETLLADIDRTAYNGRFPSDHYPVTAVLRLVPIDSHNG